MAQELFCSSCKKKITSGSTAAKFLCPSCGKTEIVRCANCRANAVKYKCAECGFTGPN
ncbi:MAG: DUF1610 domain-containing protein [bacterium]|nr:DUF1610 domain-containing protein [bacterium]